MIKVLIYLFEGYKYCNDWDYTKTRREYMVLGEYEKAFAQIAQNVDEMNLMMNFVSLPIAEQKLLSQYFNYIPMDVLQRIAEGDEVTEIVADKLAEEYRARNPEFAREEAIGAQAKLYYRLHRAGLKMANQEFNAFEFVSEGLSEMFGKMPINYGFYLLGNMLNGTQPQKLGDKRTRAYLVTNFDMQRDADWAKKMLERANRELPDWETRLCIEVRKYRELVHPEMPKVENEDEKSFIGIRYCETSPYMFCCNEVVTAACDWD